MRVPTVTELRIDADQAQHGRPRIGVSLPPWPSSGDTVAELAWSLAGHAMAALQDAGANVVPYTFQSGFHFEPSELFDYVDGALLPGGGDISPDLSSPDATPTAEALNTITHVNLRQDRFDMMFAQEAARREMPTLAICRGMQILNVTFGGSLHLDLPPSIIPHHGSAPDPLMTKHTVRARPETRVSAILGRNPGHVWSGHHQGIDRVGTGLHPTAHSRDGLIEALEYTHAPILGIQWHPEYFHDSSVSTQSRLFTYLVESARQYQLNNDPHKTSVLQRTFSEQIEGTPVDASDT